MPRTNFSAEETKVYDLALDLARGEFSLHVDKEKVGRKDLHFIRLIDVTILLCLKLLRKLQT